MACEKHNSHKPARHRDNKGWPDFGAMVTKHLSIIPTLATGKLVLMVECGEGESAGQQKEAKQEGFSDLWMARWVLVD